MTYQSMTIAGWCPFLLCLVEGTHRHPICPDCGAVRFGNAFCATCKAERPNFGPAVVVDEQGHAVATR